MSEDITYREMNKILDQYEDMLSEACGEAGRETAQGACNTAYLRRLVAVPATVPAAAVGDVVLVWKHGRNMDGTRSLVAWHPSQGMELLHDAECFVNEVD